MASLDQYPRVMMVLMTKVKAVDPGNLLIRAEFGAWPKDRLAQIHGGGDPPGHGEFCGRYYRLQACDRFLGRLFQRLRGGVFDMVAMDAVERPADGRPAGRLERGAKLAKKRLGDWLIGSGLWELVFRVRLSGPMTQFVADFQPDLIYCQGYSLGFATLPLLIARRFNLPICYQTTDDWPSYAYRGLLMGWLLRRRARQLVAEAKVRLAFGQKMRRVYERRYGARFETTYHLDAPQCFLADSGIDAAGQRIVYIGSMALRRYEAVQDLLAAVRSFPDGSRPIQIAVYCPGLPKDIPRELLDSPEVAFLPLPAHDELPRVLAEASVLFLPESFSVPPGLIEYAVSSKAHLYMMSGRPILVYGPAYSGTVEYAVEGGWAAVMTERNRDELRGLLWKLLNDREENAQRSRKARACVQANHDLTTGRERFCRLLADAAACRQPSFARDRAG